MDLLGLALIASIFSSGSSTNHKSQEPNLQEPNLTAIFLRFILFCVLLMASICAIHFNLPLWIAVSSFSLLGLLSLIWLIMFIVFIVRDS